MKKNFFILLFLFFFFLSSFLYAQPVTPPWWLSLEYGKQRFRSGNYGDALLLFEDARRDRRAMYEQMERDVIHLLSQPEARRIGDTLDRIERLANERLYRAAAAAFQELFYRVPRSSLNNSAAAALAAFDRLKNYPEAEFWIGEVYRVEGELPLALAQYRRAYSMRGELEDPGFASTLQFKIANMLLLRQEYTEMERVLLSIIETNDTLWSNAALAEAHRLELSEPGRNAVPVPYEQQQASFARSSMTRTLSVHGINRFLELYRYNNTAVEQTHRLLGFYYAAQGRASAEQHLMFAFLIQNTIILEEVRRRQFDYAFSDLASLMREVNKSRLLLSYIDEVEYFKTVYYFALSLYRNGKLPVARNLWNFLASQPQAGEWQSRSITQLRSPNSEPIVEMP